MCVSQFVSPCVPHLFSHGINNVFLTCCSHLFSHVVRIAFRIRCFTICSHCCFTCVWHFRSDDSHIVFRMCASHGFHIVFTHVFSLFHMLFQMRSHISYRWFYTCLVHITVFTCVFHMCFHIALHKNNNRDTFESYSCWSQTLISHPNVYKFGHALSQ